MREETLANAARASYNIHEHRTTNPGAFNRFKEVMGLETVRDVIRKTEAEWFYAKRFMLNGMKTRSTISWAA